MGLLVDYRSMKQGKVGWAHTYQPILDGLVPSGGRILDLGCGWRFSSLLTRYEDQATCVGVDIDPDLYQQVLRIKCMADAHVLPFEDGAFDVVSSVFVLEHIEHPDRFFGESARVLRKGGCLLLITNSWYNPVPWIASLLPQAWHGLVLRKVLRYQGEDDNAPAYYRSNSPRSLQSRCTAAGFSNYGIIHLSGAYEYFEDQWLRSAVLFLGNLLTDNGILARLKLDLFLVAQK